MPTRLDPRHPANALVIRTLQRAAPRERPVTPAAEADDPYYTGGCHPEVVEQLWDVLGKVLPGDARCLVYGRPALVHPHSGVILAFCLGTAYVMRIPLEDMPAARAAGAIQIHSWGSASGGVTNLVQECGPDWVFPGPGREELAWCRAVYERFRDPVSRDEDMLTSSSPALPPQRAGTVVLEVSEWPEWHPIEVATDPDAETIARTVRGLSWAQMTFVVLRRDAENFLEASGSLKPEDGLSARYVENGVEHVSRQAPRSVEALVAMLTSYRAGDRMWQRTIEWD